jgi:hypothetical protein
MNVADLAASALEEALASKLRDFLGGISWLHNWRVEKASGSGRGRFDLVAKIPVRDGEITLHVDCKRELRPSGFLALLQKSPPTARSGYIGVPVLAMPFVSSRLADLCSEHGWGWYDLAGNCHIEAPGLFLLERRGLMPVHRRPRSEANLSTPEAGRIIRALLANGPETRWTQRGLQEHFGELQHPPIPKPSLGLVNKVVRYLRDEAFIEDFEDRGFRLRDPLKLLYAWRDAYRFDRHERRNYFTLLRPAQLRETLYRVELEAGGAAAYAAFSAAEFQAPHVRQPKTWIYLRREHIAQFEGLTNSKIVDSGENVVVLIPDDQGVFYLSEREADGLMSRTNSVQTYVDLVHCGGRGIEAAEALVEQRLKRKWGSVQK